MYAQAEINRYTTFTDEVRREWNLIKKEYPNKYLAQLTHDLKEVFPSLKNKDYEEVINMSQELVELFISEKKTDIIRVYAWSLMLTRGLGYADRIYLLHFLCILNNLSYKRILEIEEFFLKEGWWRKGKKGMISITSYKKIPHKYDLSNRTTIKLTARCLLDRNDFLHHVISLTHLKLQNSFRYCYDKIGKNGRHKVQPMYFNQYPSNISKVGCSIRKVAEHLNLSYKFCWNYLQGSLKREYNLVETVTYEDFKKKYDISFFIRNPKYSFFSHKGKMKILMALGSTSKFENRFLNRNGKILSASLDALI